MGLCAQCIVWITLICGMVFDEYLSKCLPAFQLLQSTRQTAQSTKKIVNILQSCTQPGNIAHSLVMNHRSTHRTPHLTHGDSTHTRVQHTSPCIGTHTRDKHTHTHTRDTHERHTRTHPRDTHQRHTSTHTRETH